MAKATCLLLHNCSPSLQLGYLRSSVKSLECKHSDVFTFNDEAQDAHVGQIQRLRDIPAMHHANNCTRLNQPI